MEDYTRTDLACESGGAMAVREETVGRFHLGRLTIRKGDEKQYGKPAGEYTTIVCGKIWELNTEETEELSAVLANEIRRLAERMTGRVIGADFRVLIVGLGNPDITPDAVGPETVRRITVTRPIYMYDRALFHSLGCTQISAFAPGVFGQTGLESVDLLDGAIRTLSPDLVVAVDALAARSCDRLAATVQLSDCGIAPGSGIGNSRKAIDRDSVGTPVLSIGVPTVVDSATLVYDALEQAGIREPDEKLRQVLENGRRFYVSPKESDRITDGVATVLSDAIGIAFGGANIKGGFGI